MKRIEIIVSRKGQSRIETHGYVGSACRAATRWLEQALGIRQNETCKPEFYQQQVNEAKQQENQ
jgi:hypothetical protein